MNREAFSIVALASIMLLSIIVGVGCSSTSSVEPLTVAIVTWPGVAIPFVAKEKGYFGDLDVEIKIIDDTNVRHAGFRTGDIDIISSTVDTVALEVVQVQKDYPSPFSFALVTQGHADLLKIEDKIDFLKRMHKEVMQKIGEK